MDKVKSEHGWFRIEIFVKLCLGLGVLFIAYLFVNYKVKIDFQTNCPENSIRAYLGVIRIMFLITALLYALWMLSFTVPEISYHISYHSCVVALILDILVLTAAVILFLTNPGIADNNQKVQVVDKMFCAPFAFWTAIYAFSPSNVKDVIAFGAGKVGRWIVTGAVFTASIAMLLR